MASVFRTTVVVLVGLASTVTAKTSSLRRELQLPGIVPFSSATPSSDSNIVNGETANTGEFPWYVIFDGDVLCGGALVHPDFVVTAAHCIEGGRPSQVRIGATTASDGTTAAVCDSITHPNYRSRELENDIAVLRLCDLVDIETAEINTDDDVPGENDVLTTMGFGRTEPEADESSNTLQKLDMDFVPDDECSSRFPEHNPDYNICVDKNNGGICFGDSGSPAVDGNLVMGVASFIIQDCGSDFPDFYTRMSSYSTWVQRQICNDSQETPDNCDDLGDDDGPDGGDDGDCILLDILEFILDIILGGGEALASGAKGLFS